MVLKIGCRDVPLCKTAPDTNIIHAFQMGNLGWLKSVLWIFANLSRKMRMMMICLESTRVPARTDGKPDSCPKEFTC